MAAQVLPSVVSLGVCPCLHPPYVDSRCTRLRRQEEVNARLCAPVEMGVWACASQFSRLTGSVLRGPSVRTGRRRVGHRSLRCTTPHSLPRRASEPTVDVLCISLHNNYLPPLKPGFILTSLLEVIPFDHCKMSDMIKESGGHELRLRSCPIASINNG